MKEKYRKAVGLILIVFFTLYFICLGLPFFHDFLFDRFSVSNYEKKDGIVSDVELYKNKYSNTCENIVVDKYTIFVKCGEDYKQQFNVGDKTTYYVYNGKAYHNEDQMKSATPIGKVLDYGMIGTYLLIFVGLTYYRRKIYDYVDRISTK